MKISPLVLLFMLVPTVLAEGLPDLGESAQSDLSPVMERRIGESIMRDIRLRDPTYLEDAEISGYINEIGAKLAGATEESRQGFEFFVMRDSTLNAFALPGGYVGVHTGLILAAQSESELAGVLAHEISHVTQRHLARLMGKQSQAQIAQLLAMAVAILASRSNPQVTEAAIVAGSAVGLQAQISYTRDFEREADRIGMQVLERSGFDVRGMGAFFERLQKVGRVYENNAPGYLRTHPLTNERIADMENRIQFAPYRQVPDSLEFHLVRAKLRAQENEPRDAVADFDAQLRDKKHANAAAAHYGMASAQLRAGNPAAAAREVHALRSLGVRSPMIDTLDASVTKAQGNLAATLSTLRAARARYPQDRALIHSEIEALLADRQAQEALKVASAELTSYPSDATLRGLQARSFAALGKKLQQHRAQGELYALRGQYAAAVEQMQLAQKAGDGDFYEQSQVDARLRELLRLQAEEAKQKVR